MKKSRYSEEQIVRILREADRDTVVDVAKRHGVSEASIYAWRKRFGEAGEGGKCGSDDDEFFHAGRRI